MDWESLFTNPYFLGASALVSLIMFVAWVLGPLRRWWRRRRLDPQREIPRLFDALEQVAEEFGIPIREPLVKNGQVLPSDAIGKLESITRQLESFTDRLSMSAQEYFESGSAYYALRQFQAAIEKYDKSLRLLENPVTFNNRGVVYAELGQYERAIQDYDKALELKPDFPEVLNNRGNVYGELDQQEQAIQDFDKALELKPHFPEVLNNRGIAYGDLGQYERAIQDYDKALRLKPDYPKALNNRGAAYHHLGQYERAIRDYDRALELKPDDPEVLVNRGKAYYHLGEYERAIQDYDKALELRRPRDPTVRYVMACLYSLMNKPDEALKWLREAIDLDAKCRDEAKTDPDFDNMRDDPRFKELVGE